jgi:hypothetical protein
MEASIQGHGRGPVANQTAQARERNGNASWGTLKPQAPCPNPLRSAGSGRLHTTGKTSTCMQHTEAAQPHPQDMLQDREVPAAWRLLVNTGTTARQ